MKQKRLVFAIATALAGSPMLANSTVTLNDDGTTTGVSVWAKESKRDDTAVAIIDGITANNLEISVPVGFGFPSGGVERFVRLDLQGAKFKGSPVCDVSAITGGAVCISRTGGNGATYANFKVTSGATAVPSNGLISFTLTATEGLTPSNVNEIKITYSLHNNDVSADNLNQSLATGILNKKTGTYVEFKPVISIEATPQLPLTADVSQGFLQFVPDTFSSAGSGPIGFFSYPDPVASSILTLDNIATPADSAPATVASVISAATLTVTGDFTSVQDFTGTSGLGTYSTATNRVYLDTTDPVVAPAKPCDAVSTPASAVTEGTATFDLGTAYTGNAYICIKPNGITPMNPSVYSMAVSFTANTGYVVENYSFDKVGEIRQNGTVLDTPYITTNAGYISRIIFTNTGAKAAPYTSTIVTDSGATATPGVGAIGEIPAGANLQVNAGDLVAFSGKPRGAVRFVITAPNPSIQAVYQTVNLASGDVQSVLLNRRGGGDGK
ncbi:hypothetical protein [Thioflexithrix psekupsensis]|uniref:DUF11 domain-containing protein n=1 Tax=Thioflexithrix psekupsensis TaxID=1570016 RepID=A0A251X762_9GAMM|nr:hypothetical protein [Thioflexithrix psekupsensis]OUD13826.1 hypothetical protein TPSD3_05625 [Thioflexithrix psekupsensis]